MWHGPGDVKDGATSLHEVEGRARVRCREGVGGHSHSCGGTIVVSCRCCSVEVEDMRRSVHRAVSPACSSSPHQPRRPPRTDAHGRRMDD